MLKFSVIIVALSLLLAIPAWSADDPEEAHLSPDQITELYKRFNRLLEFDIRQHNQLVDYREFNRDTLLKMIGRSLNVTGYSGDDIAEAFEFAAEKKTTEYINPANEDKYTFTLRLPESLLRQCKPYGEDLFGRDGKQADVYIKFVYNERRLYEKSVKMPMSYHYNCTLNTSDADIERILSDSLIPESKTSVPYGLGRFEMKDFEEHNSSLWFAVERTLLNTPGLFSLASKEERQLAISKAVKDVELEIIPTLESFTAALEALKFSKSELTESSEPEKD